MALTLLAPQTPMLFMGQEFAASTRFMFFADHDRRARARWCTRVGANSSAQFRAYADPSDAGADRRSAARSVLSSTRSSTGAKRKRTPSAVLVPSRSAAAARVRSGDLAPGRSTQLDGATLTEARVRAALVRRRPRRSAARREPRSRAAARYPRPSRCSRRRAVRRGSCMWSSEDPRYGGHGVASPGRRWRSRRMAARRHSARCCWRDLDGDAEAMMIRDRQIVLRGMRDRDPYVAAQSRMADHERPRRLRLRHARRHPARKYHGLFVPNLAGAEGPAHHDLALR